MSIKVLSEVDMTGKVIFLNGVTSCGKTSIASCMKEMCRSIIYVFSNDIFHEMVSDRAFEKHEQGYSHLIADSITAQYYAARGAADAGFTVVIDGMLLDLPEYVERFGKRNIELVRDIFAGCDFTMVNMTCPPDELRRRNISRGNRGVRQSDEQLEVMTKEFPCDINIDVMTTMPDESAAIIMRYCGLDFDCFGEMGTENRFNLEGLGKQQALATIGRERRRFLEDILNPYSAKIDYCAVPEFPKPGKMTPPLKISVTIQQIEPAAEELTARGYEKIGMTFVRRGITGEIKETVKLHGADDIQIHEPMDYLCRTVSLQIDRKMGTAHPKHPDMIYPINYGYVKDGIEMPDGEPIDAYLLEVEDPVETYTGYVSAVICRQNDNEDKLVVVPADNTKKNSFFTIRMKVEFVEQYFDSVFYMNAL